MKRKITFLIAAAIMLLSLIVQPIKAIGQSDIYSTSTNVTWSSDSKVNISSSQYDAKKIAKGGNMTFTVPAHTTVIYVHCAAWNKEAASLSASAPTMYMVFLWWMPIM